MRYSATLLAILLATPMLQAQVTALEQFGTGCGGHLGQPSTISITPALRPGAWSTMQIDHMTPFAPAVLLLGTSNTDWFGVTLPLSLTGAGMPGCSLLLAPIFELGFFTESGTALASFFLPRDPAIAGINLYFQTLFQQPGLNALEIASSSGLRAYVSPLSVPMTTATRTSGPAPLSVVFDPIGGSTGVVQPAGSDPNHAEFGFAWDFGDPAAGNWAHTGRSKNRSTAWIGAHVYEAPGTYRATLRVTDAQGNEFDYHQDITVTDPDAVFAARTFYVAANGNDANPGTQSAPFLTAQRGLQAAFSTSGAARLRFRRGDSFVSGSGWSITNTTGPYQIDAYGSGNRPRIVFTGTNVGMSLQGSRDVRVCDLDVVSTSTTQASWATGVSAGTQTLVHGCSFDSFGFGLGSSSINELCAYECEFLNSVQYGVYLFGADDTSAIHLAILGSRLDVAGQHLIRTYMSRSVIQSNSFQNAGYSSLKLVGRPLPNPSRYVCVVDNDIRSEVTDPLGIGPEGSTYDQHASHYLVEGNYFYSRQTGNSCMQVRGYDITVRNNVFDVANRRAVNVTRWGIGPMPANVVIEHNTAVGVAANLYFVLADSTNPTVVRNNLLYCPNGTVETPAGSVTSQHNLVPGASPFMPIPGLLGGQFALTSTGANVAVNAGVTSQVRYDFAGLPRPSNVDPDVGAFQRQ